MTHSTVTAPTGDGMTERELRESRAKLAADRVRPLAVRLGHLVEALEYNAHHPHWVGLTLETLAEEARTVALALQQEFPRGG